MARVGASDEFRGAEFVDLSMAGSVFRAVDLSSARMRGVRLTDAEIDGDIGGLRVNGVDVEPLIESELDRRYPERTKLQPTTPEGMREALAVLESLWLTTIARARALPASDLHRSVYNEWNLTETLRHLVFITDAWFARSVLGEPHPFHPFGMPPTSITDGVTFGIDPAASPGFEEVAEVRAVRLGWVRAFLETATQDELDRVREPNTSPGRPSPARRTAASCLHVVFNEEWAHHQYAVRDLAVIEAG